MSYFILRRRLVYNPEMQKLGLRKLVLFSVVGGMCALPAWCSRSDKGGSTYGANTAPCPSSSGPQSPTVMDSITVTCFGPGSGVGNATLFELQNSGSTFPSSFSVLVEFGSPATTDYGLILCDGFGSIPCTNKDSALGPVNPVDFTGTPTPGSNDELFTFSNFTGELDFYINEGAVIADVGPAGKPIVPEPRNTTLAGLLLLCSLPLARLAVNKRNTAVQN